MQVLIQLVAGKIGKTDQRMQRFLSREFIEQIYRNDIIHFVPIHIFLTDDAKLFWLCKETAIQITDWSITFTGYRRFWGKSAIFVSNKQSGLWIRS